MHVRPPSDAQFRELSAQLQSRKGEEKMRRTSFIIYIAVIVIVLFNLNLANAITVESKQFQFDKTSTNGRISPYSWFYISCKIFYVPLYYCIYFFGYFVYLIVKSINLHRVCVHNIHKVSNNQKKY